jgi:hypothetical protein
MPTRRTETTRKPSTVNPILPALVLAGAGWLGLGYLTFNVHPTWPAKMVLLALLAVALMGTAWPVLLALHRRFRGEPSPWTVWRQSAWVAAFSAASAWLQMNRLLNIALAAILAGVFVVIELIFVLRARQETRHD